MNHFANTLIEWYKRSKRPLPWRENPSPYHIWISEIIHQQTRIATGVAYYERFVIEYPTVQHLALAPVDEVLRLWQGLGYYSRARNLHKAAKNIFSEFNGKFPSKYSEILKLPGVGKYTAAAIASIAFKEKVPAIDGNVYRVISRIFGVDSVINTTKAHNEFSEIVFELMPDEISGDFNQALMEFGALQCTPKSPNCETCPFVSECEAFKSDRIAFFPQKKKAIATRNRYFHFLIIKNEDSIFIEKRVGKDIWHSLYQFPLVETESEIQPEELEQQVVHSFIEMNQLCAQDVAIELITAISVHVLSHQKLHIRFIHLKMKEMNVKDLIQVDLSLLNQYAFPKPLVDYIESNLFD